MQSRIEILLLSGIRQSFVADHRTVHSRQDAETYVVGPIVKRNRFFPPNRELKPFDPREIMELKVHFPDEMGYNWANTAKAEWFVLDKQALDNIRALVQDVRCI